MELTPVGIVRSDIKMPIPPATDDNLDLEDRKTRIREFRKAVEKCRFGNRD